MKCVAFFALVGAAVAMPFPDNAPVYQPAPPSYGPPPSYAPPKYAKDEEKFPPQPYEFKYGVADDYTGTQYQAAETQDAAGTVLGSYTVDLPDGRKQTVTYRADHEGGFVADVSYEGTPVYPPEPAEGYGNSYKKNIKEGYAPKYAPAPPKYAPAPAPYDN